MRKLNPHNDDSFEFYKGVVASKRNSAQDPDYKERLENHEDTVEKQFEVYDESFDDDDLVGLVNHGFANGDKATHKLSDGEKTMISLCFFLASSIKRYNSSDKFFNSIFIIDDPVSSTSYNYFFGICNLIKHFQEVIVDEIWSDEKNKLQQAKIQKIILTHNTHFFNVLRVNVFKEKAKYFILSQKDIREIPKNHLKSEFENSLLNIKLATKDSEPKPNVISKAFANLRNVFNVGLYPRSILCSEPLSISANADNSD